MDHAIVTVVIPVYNGEHHISRCLKSVLGQTFESFNIIVVNDGSTDDTASVVGRFADCRISLISQANSGPGSARNAGALAARTEFVCFLDSDDEFFPTFLERHLEALLLNPECDYTLSPYLIAELNYSNLDQWKRINVLEGPWSVPDRLDCFCLHQLLTTLHYSSSIVCRTRLFMAGLKFYEGDRCCYGEDRFFQLQLILSCTPYLIFEPLVTIHHDALSRLSHRHGPLSHLSNPIISDNSLLFELIPMRRAALLSQYIISRETYGCYSLISSGNLWSAMMLIRRSSNTPVLCFALFKILVRKINRFFT